MKPFISVVMPVYNVEKHLEKAAGSFLSQTFADFELILVDDCSPDGSGAICDRLAESDSRVRVLHLPQNGGLSNARNSGMDIAEGRYLCFADSDDYVEPNLLETLRRALERHPVQLIVFGIQEDYYNDQDQLSSTEVVRYPETLCRTAEEVHAHMVHLEEHTLYGYAYNKLYDLEQLRASGVRFQTITLIEDILFNVAYCQQISSMMVLDFTPYHYGKRLDNSLTSKFLPDYFALVSQRVQAVFDQYGSWNACNDEVRRILGNIYVRYIFSALQRNCDPRANMSHADRKQWLRTLYEQPLYRELLPHAAPDSRLVRTMSALLRSRRTGLCLASGRVIYLVKTRLPMLFARVKHNR